MGKIEKIEIIEYGKGSELFARIKKKGETFGKEINLKGGKEWTKKWTRNLQDMQDIEEQLTK